MADSDSLFDSLIDLPLWDAAQWRGVMYLIDPHLRQPPILGLIFRHQDAAFDIFAGWRERFARDDEDDLLRLAIIEGPIPGKPPGYAVHLTIEPTVAIAAAKARNFDFDPSVLFSMSQSFHMVAPNGSPTMQAFKAASQRMGRYILAPSISHAEQLSGDTITDHPEMGFLKHRIHFRASSEVSRADIDGAIYAPSVPHNRKT